jgi:cytochrome P450
MTLAVGPDPEIEQLLFSTILTPEGRKDPYQTYRILHEKAPVYRTSMGGLVLSRYDDCKNLLRDNNYGKNRSEEAMKYRLSQAVESGLSDVESDEIMGFFGRRTNMLFMDPPDHTRLRGLVSRAFTPKTVEKLRPRIEEMTDNLLDLLDDKTEIMEDVAWKLPSMVICELLGIPDADRESLRPFVRIAVRLLEPTFNKEDIFNGIKASRQMESYLTDLIAEKRKHPDEHLISKLIEARDGADALTEEELLSTCSLIFGAGFETTTNLIGNGLYALLRHPDQMKLARNNLDKIALIVEELLRYDTPVQFDGRAALIDTYYEENKVEKGNDVMTLLAAANHDPTHFNNPQELNVLRDEGPCLSFASGIHYCLGASLARLEGQVFFTSFLTKFKKIELLEEPIHRDSITIRGLESLTLSLQA